VLGLLLEEFDLFIVLLFVVFPLLIDDSLDTLNLGLLFNDFFGLLFLAFFKFASFLNELSLAMLSLKLLAHCKRHRTVVECLVGLNVRIDIALHS